MKTPLDYESPQVDDDSKIERWPFLPRGWGCLLLVSYLAFGVIAAIAIFTAFAGFKP